LTSAQPHTVGIVAESASDLHTLRTIVQEAGLSVSSTIGFPQWDENPLTDDVDAWIINLDVEALEQESDTVDRLIDSVSTPVVILCEGGSPPLPGSEGYDNWKRRMLGKVSDIAGSISISMDSFSKPDNVWVLAGSIGGPEAVRDFLAMLPEEPDVAFVYANHLQSDFEDNLAKSVGRDSPIPVVVASHGDALETNKVLVMSSQFVAGVKSNGTIGISREPWPGQYQPNLDYVVASVAKHFGHLGGVIIFSGMCDDGAASCRIMKQFGGQVWAQHPLSCINSAMPDEAIKTGCVDQMGTPQELADMLMAYVSSVQKQSVATN
jgi:chemosensory pili system protein ChpB (putative protein-glutamate methylesterase)